MYCTTKMQKAGRSFLLRLVAEYGPDEACRILRSLADEIEGLMREHQRHARDPDRHDPFDA
jgi:hypothetical protein